jgi:hypothetical protein
MKIYTFSRARQELARILEESKNEEVIISRRSGDTFTIVPRKPRRRSPFDVPGLNKKITRRDILEALNESRKRPL